MRLVIIILNIPFLELFLTYVRLDRGLVEHSKAYKVLDPRENDEVPHS